MTFQLPQHGDVRAVFHRFRACSDAHRDRYHAECGDCLLIETNADRCIETTHVRDAGGKCLTCELLDGRVAGVEDNRLLAMIRKLRRD